MVVTRFSTWRGWVAQNEIHNINSWLSWCFRMISNSIAYLILSYSGDPRLLHIFFLSGLEATPKLSVNTFMRWNHRRAIILLEVAWSFWSNIFQIQSHSGPQRLRWRAGSQAATAAAGGYSSMFDVYCIFTVNAMNDEVWINKYAWIVCINNILSYIYNININNCLQSCKHTRQFNNPPFGLSKKNYSIVPWIDPVEHHCLHIYICICIYIYIYIHRCMCLCVCCFPRFNLHEIPMFVIEFPSCQWTQAVRADCDARQRRMQVRILRRLSVTKP
jgi:hypothetical protein